MNIWDTILQDLEKRYFIELIMWVVELITIILGLIYVRNQTIGKLFLFYLIVDFIILNIGTYFQYFSKNLTFINSFINYSNTFISLIELYIYYCYFKLVLENNRTKILMNILTIIYVLIILAFTTNNFVFLKANSAYLSYAISAIGFAFLLYPSVSYFFELMNKYSTESLFKKPSFWIVSGIFFYSIISIPYYLLDNFLNTNKSIYRIMLSTIFFYLPFTLNFVFLTKAFLCRKPLQI